MLTLRPFSRTDFATLIGWIPSPEFLLQWAGPQFTFPLDVAQLDGYLREAEADPPSRLIYTAVEDGASVGHIELARIDRRNRSATVSRVLVGDPSRRGRGAGLRIVREILRIGFAELDLHRIDLVVFDFNTSAIACYERAGFIREGCLREARRFGDTYWTLVQMSILEQEWRVGGPTA